MRNTLRHLRTLANACERLQTLADACRRLRTLGEQKRNDFWSPPGPLDPNLETGTLLLRIREKLQLAAGPLFLLLLIPPPQPAKREEPSEHMTVRYGEAQTRAVFTNRLVLSISSSAYHSKEPSPFSSRERMICI